MDVVYYDLLVSIGVRVHLFPSRTQKLSLLSPTIVAGRLAAKIGNANTITGLPKGGPVFIPVCVGAGSAWTADGRSAGSCSAGGRGPESGSAARRKAQNKAQQACGRCFIRNAPFCFSALAEKNPINYYPLPVLCQRPANRQWQRGSKSQIVSLTFMQRRRVCVPVSRFLFCHTHVSVYARRRRRRYTYRNRARAW